ncbi:hypothetical protein C475_22234 [Halosimplex carlsbadense 2-9-1]|uniref:Uncharacterized protein n=1 Tax=Halosimplex carlsbadense 2-9-1 TaxID=797114 RepID=M0C8Z8_9EURY|nr:hypothetical protein [Halosimplex carlsbadense]ELZ19710.1 hypothetical protein C475_22234 [Halosimplex carlsbadense 2-9-1]
MASPGDEIAPQTTENHFTDPVEIRETAYNIERCIHLVPLDWFLVVSGEIHAWTYEHYLDNEQHFEKRGGQYSIDNVYFEYESEPNPDGTGKPFKMRVIDPNDDEIKCHPRTHYLIWLLDYDEESYEVVRIDPTEERDAVLVTIQERLPHVPRED